MDLPRNSILSKTMSATLASSSDCISTLKNRIQIFIELASKSFDFAKQSKLSSTKAKRFSLFKETLITGSPLAGSYCGNIFVAGVKSSTIIASLTVPCGKFPTYNSRWRRSAFAAAAALELRHSLFFCSAVGSRPLSMRQETSKGLAAPFVGSV